MPKTLDLRGRVRHAENHMSYKDLGESGGTLAPIRTPYTSRAGFVIALAPAPRDQYPNNSSTGPLGSGTRNHTSNIRNSTTATPTPVATDVSTL